METKGERESVCVCEDVRSEGKRERGDKGDGGREE